MRTLTLRELNRATLARQLLLRRHRLSVTKAIERTAGLQAQWPPSPYIGLWTRLDGFAPDDLLRAVRRRRVVKATLMRRTLHLVSARDYLAYGGIYRASIMRELERQLAALDEKLDLAERAYDALAEIPELELVPPERPPLSNLAFRLRDGDDEAQRALQEHVNGRRRVFLSSTVLDGRFTLRFSIVSFRTHADRIDEAIEHVRSGVRQALTA